MNFITNYCFLFFGLFGLISCNNTSTSNYKKPNILTIIIDDAGWSDVGYQSEDVLTPIIDSIATRSTILDRLYTHPTCSPTRASFLTGLPASRLGIVAPISGKSKLTIPNNISVLPKTLSDLNYQTALFGKWHLGLSPENGPNKFGFDYAYGFLHGQIDQYTHRYKNGDSSWHRNGIFIEEKGHTTDLITKDFINWMHKTLQNKKKSFFAQIAYSAPHFPLQEEGRWKELYRNKIKNPSRLDFAASMSHLDDSIGKIIQALRDSEQLKNTYIIFFSDNGGMENWYPTNQYQGIHGPNPVLGNNNPLKGWKTDNYEGGIRVPAWIYSPKSDFQKISKEFLSVVDINKLVYYLAGGNTIEGEEIYQLLEGKIKNRESSIYIRGHKHSSLIIDKFKIIEIKKNNEFSYKLYDLIEDPNEVNDLSEIMPDVLKSMKSKLLEEMEKDPSVLNYPKI